METERKKMSELNIGDTVSDMADYKHNHAVIFKVYNIDLIKSTILLSYVSGDKGHYNFINNVAKFIGMNEFYWHKIIK